MELFLGACVSAFIQGLKLIYKKWIGEEWQNIAIISTLLLTSLIVSAFIYILKIKGLWESFCQIALYAAGIWAILIRPLERK